MALAPKITAADIDAVVAWTIIRSARRAARLLSRALSAHELTPVEFGVLAQLAAATGEELTQAELARAVQLRPQSVAPVIEGLADRGLLLRAGRRGRGRSGRLLLSAAGAEVLRTAFPDVHATTESFAAQAELVESLNETLLAFLGQGQQNGDPE